MKIRKVLSTIGSVATVGAAAAAIERAILAAPHYHGPRSDHFNGDQFVNRQEGHQSGGSFLKWRLEREPGPWREWVDDPPGPPPPERVDGGRLRVTFVNHATMLIQMDGLNILTDPIWSVRCSPSQAIGPKRHRPAGIRFDDLPPIDVVLVSHNHYDHLDIGTLDALQRHHHPRIFTPLGNGALMRRHGITGATELDWWSGAPLAGNSRVTLVPAQHFCARGISDRNRNLWGGFVVSSEGGNVYFAGDTGWGDHFKMIGERFDPIRLALLPIGAYLPRWFMRPVHIEPAEAVAAHLLLGARTSVPMHYGTFNLGDDGEMQPLDDLRAAIAATDASFRVLEHGEGYEVP